MCSASLLKFWRPWIVVLTGSALLLACTLGESAPKRKKRAPVDCAVEDCYSDLPVETTDPLEPDLVNRDSGAFGAPERPSNGGHDQGLAGPGDGGKTYCDPTLASGDLAIVEIMIASKAGSGDSAEWVEIQSTRDCWLKLQGVSVESPRGAEIPNVATITDDLELEPHGTFTVASSSEPAKNHNLPGKVIGWNATDVLKNDGDTVNVKLGTILIDSVSYPNFNNLTAGRTLAFPADCKWSDRKDWARWSLSFGEFAPGFKGTPNAPNKDITCF